MGAPIDLESGEPILLEDGTDLLEEGAGTPSGGILLEDGGGILLEDGTPLLLEGGASVFTLREAVATWLQSTAALAAISPRVYFGVPSQLSLYPCTTLKVTDRSYGHNLSGADGTSRATVELTMRALQESQCITMAEAVRNVADGFRGLQSGVAILRMFLADEADDQVAPPDGSDRWIYAVTLEYRCDHRVPAPTSVTQANV